MEPGTLRLRVARHLGCMVLAVVSCREPVASPNARSTTLAPASPTQLTGMVGTPVAEVPSVMVRDASGRAVAGVPITFTVMSGGGVLQTPRAVSVVFTADAVAGPPFRLEKVDGDGQIALPGAALGVRPGSASAMSSPTRSRESR